MAQTGKECVEFLENARNAVEALAVVEDRENKPTGRSFKTKTPFL